MLNSDAIQPVSVNMPPEVLRANYVKVQQREIANPLWHYEIALHKENRAAPPYRVAPELGGFPITIGLFNRANPQCDTEIFGMHLKYDIHPADWLDIYVQEQKFEVLARKRLPLLGGDAGDLVVRWEVDGAPWMGRMFAMKAGPRVLIFWTRTRAAHYAELAESMFLSLSSLRLLEESTSPLAENVQWVNAQVPRPWRVAVPDSWQIVPQKGVGGGASFQAALLTQAPQGTMMHATAVLSVSPKANYSSAVDAMESMRNILTNAGALVGAFSPEPALFTPPFTGSWRSETFGTLDIPQYMVCRVLEHADFWLAAIGSMPPAAAPEYWMRGKRLVDLLLSTFELQ